MFRWAHKVSVVKQIQTTVFTSLHAKLCMIAAPYSCNNGRSERREWTATLVVTLILLVCWLLYVHSEMYSSHSDELRFSNKFTIWKRAMYSPFTPGLLWRHDVPARPRLAALLCYVDRFQMRNSWAHDLFCLDAVVKWHHLSKLQPLKFSKLSLLRRLAAPSHVIIFLLKE